MVSRTLGATMARSMRAASFGTLMDLVSDGAPLGAVGLGVRRAIDPPDQSLIRLTLGAGGGDEGRDRAGPESDPGGRFLARPAPASPGMGQGVALEAEEDRKTLRWTVFPTTAAALPGGAETLRDGGLDALMRIADDRLHAPRRPRRVSLRRNSVQIGSASEVPVSKPGTSRRPSVFTPMAGMTATESWPLLRHWSERQWRPARRAGPRGRTHRSRDRASPLPAAG